MKQKTENIFIRVSRKARANLKLQAVKKGMSMTKYVDMLAGVK